jgi:hypothetical protein
MIKRILIATFFALGLAGVASAQIQNYGCLATGCNTGVTGFSGTISANLVAKGTGSANTLTASTITDDGTNVTTTKTFSAGTAATGITAGDMSAARAAGTGKFWFGSNGSQSMDFALTTAGQYSLTGGLLSVLTGGLASGTKATGIATGDVSASRSTTTGKVWIGSNGSQSLDFGITTASRYTLIGGPLDLSATGDKILVLKNGGHISSLLGTATLPGVSTGTVTAGGTDNAMEVTGATSPATVTFNTAFAAQPICVCGDETAATGVCKAVPNANGQTVVVTTAATDSFNLICIGK